MYTFGALGLVAVALLAGSFFAGHRVAATRIHAAVDRAVSAADVAHQAEVERLEATIRDKDAQLKASELKYRRLKDLITVKAAEAERITLPEGANEIKDRMAALGYKPLH